MFLRFGSLWGPGSYLDSSDQAPNMRVMSCLCTPLYRSQLWSWPHLGCVSPPIWRVTSISPIPPCCTKKPGRTSGISSLVQFAPPPPTTSTEGEGPLVICYQQASDSSLSEPSDILCLPLSPGCRIEKQIPRPSRKSVLVFIYPSDPTATLLPSGHILHSRPGVRRSETETRITSFSFPEWFPPTRVSHWILVLSQSFTEHQNKAGASAECHLPKAPLGDHPTLKGLTETPPCKGTLQATGTHLTRL